MEVARELQGQKLPYYAQSTQMVLAGYPPQDVVADLPSIEGELRQQFTFSGGKNMHMPTKRLSGGAIATAVASTALVGLAPTAAHAADSDVVISEIMYHAPDPDLTEFIELANRSNAPVDISGWSFSAGITLVTTAGSVFPPGTVIPAKGRLVGTGDAASFHNQYGFDADFSFAGTSLSNGGEQITLVNAGASVVDDLTYDDAVPWPLTPDGVAPGPSLELKNLDGDNSNADSWAASNTPYGTPRAVNSVELEPPASITGVATSPASPVPNQPFQVVATLLPGSSAALTYKVMFGSDVTVPMADDAASPGGAGDGVFAAAVPGVAKEQLVRYKIAATVGTQTVSAPPAGDSMPYLGVVVKDQALGAQYPVLRWFMTDADYTKEIAGTCDDVGVPAVISFGDQVVDNAEMRIKGHSSCTDTKKKWDISLPAGHLITFGAPFQYPVDEFNLNSRATPVPGVAWETNKQVGDPSSVAYTMVRTQKNGSFFSVVELMEKYDNIWRANHGYGSWAMYKVDAGSLRTYSTAAALAASGDLDKKTPDDGDYTDAWQLTQMLSKPDSPSKRAWMYENLDIPEIVNFMADTVLYRAWDSGGKNFYLVRDINGSGRWRILHWDLDGVLSGGSDPKGDFVVPSTSNKLYASMLAVPEIAAMHYRRVRTLHDQWLTNNTWLGWYDSWTGCCGNDIKLDNTAWKSQSLSSARTKIINGIAERKSQIAAHTKPGEVPVSQSANPNIVINEIQYHPIPDGNAEYLELYNPSPTESVDLSGWTVDGVGTFTVPSGTVLGPKSYGVIVKNDAAFRAAFGGSHFVIGQYSDGLDDTADSIQLIDGTRTVDAVAYTNTAPWPAAAAGTGPSMELNDPGLDNSVGSSWHASSNSGTPGAVNSGGGAGGGGTSTVLDYGATWKYLATGPDQGSTWRAASFNDSAWPSGAANLGFKNKNTTTIPSTTGRVTYYFRTSVTIAPGAPLQSAELSLVRDDGAVVYVNGVEVARSNMPSGTISFTSKAAGVADGQQRRPRTSSASPHPPSRSAPTPSR